MRYTEEQILWAKSVVKKNDGSAPTVKHIEPFLEEFKYKWKIAPTPSAMCQWLRTLSTPSAPRNSETIPPYVKKSLDKAFSTSQFIVYFTDGQFKAFADKATMLAYFSEYYVTPLMVNVFERKNLNATYSVTIA